MHVVIGFSILDISNKKPVTMRRFPFSVGLQIFLILLLLLSSCDESQKMQDIDIAIIPENAGSVIPSTDITVVRGQSLQFLAQNNEGYVFTGWTGSINSSENPIEIIAEENVELSANFSLKKYDLDIQIQGKGRVSESLIVEKTSVDHGSTVALLAIADEGWKFVNWTGDIESEEADLTLNMTSNIQLTAVFELDLADPIAVNKTNDTKVYMHYMPWFQSKEYDGYWGYHWTMNNRNPDQVVNGRRDIASHFYPLIGPYSSKDPDVAEYHLLLMKYAGIDGVLIDWYGTYNVNDYKPNLEGSNNLIEMSARVGLEFGIVYEDRTTAAVVNAGQATTKVEAAKTDFEYITENYFPKDNYIRIDGNPLALAWTPIEIESPVEWTQILEVTDPNINYLALWYQIGDLGNNGDGEYAWVYGGNRNHLQDLRSFYSNRINQFPLGIGAAYPGFVDFYVEGGVGNIIGWEIPHNGTLTINQTLDLATKNNVDYLQLVTWNDFGEGTMIEPSIEFGYSFLTTIQDFTGVEYDETVLDLIFHLYNLRKEYAGNDAIQGQLNEVFNLLIQLKIDDASLILNEYKN